MNILITGVAGGIGSSLALQLKYRGHNIVGVDNMNNGYYDNIYDDIATHGKKVCTFYERDIRDDISIPEILEKEKIDIVIHLAAITSLPEAESHPHETIDVNVGGTAAILDAVRKSNVKRTIVASTSAIYENNIIMPYTENLPVGPRLMYPLSKKLMEEVVESYKVNYGMNIVTLRFFNVFGPRQDIYRTSPPLVNYIIRCVAKGKQATFYSDGSQKRDYVYVDDVTDMITLCMTSEKAVGKTFNVCTGTLTSVSDIIGYAEKAFGKFDHKFVQSERFWGAYKILHKGPYPLRPEIIAKEVNKRALGSPEKAKIVLGWTPNTNIEELMIRTFKEGLERFKR